MSAWYRMGLLSAMVLTSALLGACAGVLPGPAPSPARTYVLAPDLPSWDGAALSPRGSGPTILVARPEDAAGYATQRMAYLERDYRLDYFAEHEWVASPAAMLGPLLVKALRGGGAFAAVSDDASGISSDLRLDTVVESLHQDFRTRPSQARVELRVQVVEPEQRRILATRVFADAEPAPSDDPYGGVVAANRALSRLLPQIADFAAETAGRRKAAAARTEASRGPSPMALTATAGQNVARSSGARRD
jgi:cholesterol transport system auxiliary component